MKPIILLALVIVLCSGCATPISRTNSRDVLERELTQSNTSLVIVSREMLQDMVRSGRELEAQNQDLKLQLEAIRDVDMNQGATPRPTATSTATGKKKGKRS
jgi:hypothetical protein